jgi:hypothetical protein
MKMPLAAYCLKCGSQVLFPSDTSLSVLFEPHLIRNKHRKKDRTPCPGGDTLRDGICARIESLVKENIWWTPEDSAYGSTIDALRARLSRG